MELSPVLLMPDAKFDAVLTMREEDNTQRVDCEGCMTKRRGLRTRWGEREEWPECAWLAHPVGGSVVRSRGGA
jgi:hypothetical protein